MAKIQSLIDSKISFSQITKQSVFFAISVILVIAVFAVANVKAQEVPELRNTSQVQTFSTPTPKISGTILGGDKVMVFIDEVLNGVADVVEGEFEYNPFLPLASGSHSFKLRAKNSVTGDMSEYSAPVPFYIEPNPAPVLLAPGIEAKLGQDRAWVGGVAQNNSLVRVFVDGLEYARTKVHNHASGTGSFGVNLPGLSLGEHVITAIARDSLGKDSFVSSATIINISASTPAPILNKPVVNADSGIEKPFVTGIVKNNLEVSIVIDDKIVQTLNPATHSSGVTSFVWQVASSLELGKHKIEAFASDGGKLSNNSLPVYWQVGEVQDSGMVEGDEISKVEDPLIVVDDKTNEDGVGGPPPEEEDSVLKVVDPEPEEDTKPLTVQDDLDEEEEPVIPDVEEKPVDGMTMEDEVDEGRVDADDDKLAVADDLDNDDLKMDDVDEISPGAVVKKVDKTEDNEAEFTLNTSLIIGIVILIFLLLSILVWYIQEKKDRLGQKVVDIFREDEAGGEFNEPEVEFEDIEQDVSVTDMSDQLPGDIDVRLEEEEKEEELESPMFFGEEEFEETEKEEQVEWPQELPEDQLPQEELPQETYPFEEAEEDDDDSSKKPEDLPPPPPPMF
jgi:hypothetical protein